MVVDESAPLCQNTCRQIERIANEGNQMNPVITKAMVLKTRARLNVRTAIRKRRVTTMAGIRKGSKERNSLKQVIRPVHQNRKV